MKKTFYSFLKRAIWLTAFLAVCVFTLVFAFGYQYDATVKSLKKTSIIDLPVKYKNVDVKLNGKFIVQNLPYQIKSLDPGRYILKVTKDGYEDWNREIKVKNDIVSIVDDLFLVPKTFLKIKLKEFLGAKDDIKFIFSANFLIQYKPGDKKIEVLTFKKDGQYKAQIIDLGRSGINKIEKTQNDNLLIKFDKNTFAWVDIEDNRTKFFVMPDNASDLKFSKGSQSFFYLKENNLYRIPLYLLSLKTDFEASANEVRSGIDNYSVSGNGLIYFVSHGFLFEANEDGERVRLVGKNLGKFVNTQVIDSNSRLLLIANQLDGKRFLFNIHSDTLDLVTEDLVKAPIVFANGYVAFQNSLGNVVVHDLVQNKLVNEFEGSTDFDLLMPFSTNRHLFYFSKNSIWFSDIYGANRYKVFDSVEFKSIWQKQNAVFLLDGIRLDSIMLPEVN